MTTIDLVTLTGPLIEFRPVWSGPPRRREAPVTFNQANHLRALTDPSARGVWLAGTVEFPTPPAPERLAHAVTRLLTEHDALRAAFPDPSAARAQIYGADQVSISVTEHGEVSTPTIAELMSTRCRHGDTPALFFGLIESTLIIAFDHAHGDALTVDLILRRIRELYLDPEIAPRPGESFYTRCELDAMLGEKLSREGAEHPLVATWRRYFGTTSGMVPSFPLPLGSIPQGGAPQRTRVIELLDDAAAEPINKRIFATILTDLASSIADLGGPQTLSTVIPIHTRGRSASPWHQTAGWLVTNAPVRIRAGDVDGTVRALRNAIGLAEVPLDHVLDRCRPAMTSEDVFMVSYLDYRRLGEPLPGGRHISATTTTDSVQMWFSRTVDGLDLRLRHPDTESAAAVIDALADRLGRRLTSRAEAAATRAVGPETESA